MERSDGIGKRRRRGSARVSGGGRREVEDKPDRRAPPVSDSEREKSGGSADWAGWAEGKRERR
uniref:Uncharacterized protein n=1 Tax=Oryza sativa subsp. japonica TaxID=39947 RepID=Q5VQC0_ORYSJ|nr:hypothetical protein [Oryza sativa Japonica Group]